LVQIRRDEAKPNCLIEGTGSTISHHDPMLPKVVVLHYQHTKYPFRDKAQSTLLTPAGVKRKVYQSFAPPVQKFEYSKPVKYSVPTKSSLSFSLERRKFVGSLPPKKIPFSHFVACLCLLQKKPNNNPPHHERLLHPFERRRNIMTSPANPSDLSNRADAYPPRHRISVLFVGFEHQLDSSNSRDSFPVSDQKQLVVVRISPSAKTVLFWASMQFPCLYLSLKIQPSGLLMSCQFSCTLHKSLGSVLTVPPFSLSLSLPIYPHSQSYSHPHPQSHSSSSSLFLSPIEVLN
jgi:hypothetical protein